MLGLELNPKHAIILKNFTLNWSSMHIDQNTHNLNIKLQSFKVQKSENGTTPVKTCH